MNNSKPNPYRKYRATIVTGLIAGCLLTLVGCKSTDVWSARDLHGQCKVQQAADTVKTMSQPEDQDTVWAGLESGTVLLDAGQYAQARVKLDETDRVIRAIDEDEQGGSAAGFTNTVSAAMLSDQLRDYLPRPYERVLLHQNRAIAAMCGGDPLAAAPIMRQATEIQHQIEEFDWEGVVIGPADLDAAASNNPDLKHAGSSRGLMQSDAVRTLSTDLPTPPRTPDMRAPSAYFTSFVAHAGQGNWPEAEFSARKLQEVIGRDPQIMKSIRDCVASQDLANNVWILVGSGHGPTRGETTIRVPIPIPTNNAKLTYFKASLPTIQTRPTGRATSIALSHNGTTTPAVLVDSPESTAISDFHSRRTELWGPPLMRGAGRAAAVAIAQNQTDDDLLKLGLLIGGVVMSEVDEADQRIWSTAPAEYWIASVPRPVNNTAELIVEGRPISTIRIEDSQDFAYIRLLNSQVALVHSGSSRPTN